MRVTIHMPVGLVINKVSTRSGLGWPKYLRQAGSERVYVVPTKMINEITLLFGGTCWRGLFEGTQCDSSVNVKQPYLVRVPRTRLLGSGILIS
jgi:hypothetical protein